MRKGNTGRYQILVVIPKEWINKMQNHSFDEGGNPGKLKEKRVNDIVRREEEDVSLERFKAQRKRTKMIEGCTKRTCRGDVDAKSCRLKLVWERVRRSRD